MGARDEQTSDALTAEVSALYEAEGRQLFDFARHLGMSDTQAADVLHDSLLRLWQEYRRGAVIHRPAGWLYRTVYRNAMQQHRVRRQLARLLPRLAPQHPAYIESEASDRLAVWAEVDRLPERQRSTLYLRYVVGLPFDEVATVLGISASAARTHASRGIATLRERLAAEEVHQ